MTGLDLTPALLDQARENARIARMPQIVWPEGEEITRASGGVPVLTV